MLFHWYLFVFLIILYAVARVGNQRYRVYVAGEYEGRYKWFTALVIVAVLTYVAAMRADRFGDTGAYIRGYMEIDPTWDGIVQIFRNDGKDKGFVVTATILKMLIGDSIRIYLGVIAGFCLLCVFYVYRKHSSNLFMTAFLFLASGEYMRLCLRTHLVRHSLPLQRTSKAPELHKIVQLRCFFVLRVKGTCAGRQPKNK